MRMTDLQWERHPLDPTGSMASFNLHGLYVNIATTKWTGTKFCVFVRPERGEDRHFGWQELISDLDRWLRTKAYTKIDFEQGTAA